MVGASGISLFNFCALMACHRPRCWELRKCKKIEAIKKELWLFCPREIASKHVHRMNDSSSMRHVKGICGNTKRPRIAGGVLCFQSGNRNGLEIEVDLNLRFPFHLHLFPGFSFHFRIHRNRLGRNLDLKRKRISLKLNHSSFLDNHRSILSRLWL